MKQALEELFACHAWARARLLAAAEQLPYEALRRPVLIPGGNEDGSLHATLSHIVAAQAHWLTRFEGDAERRVTPSYPDLQAIARAWEQADAALRSVVAADDLARSVRYFRASTAAYEEQPLWQLLLHVSNHTTHHRAEACAALTALGSPPESVDLIDFLRR